MVATIVFQQPENALHYFLKQNPAHTKNSGRKELDALSFLIKIIS
jgi:hypothetical protein